MSAKGDRRRARTETLRSSQRDSMLDRLLVFANEYGLVIIIIVGIIAWLLGFNPGPIEDPYGRYVP